MSIDTLLLKALTKRLIKMAGGIDAASQVCRVTPQQLSNYGNIINPDVADVIPTLDVIIDLEAHVGVPIISGRIAESCCAKPATNQNLRSLASDVVIQMGEAQAELEGALADGELTISERQRVAKEFEDVRDAAQHAAQSALAGATQLRAAE